MAQMHEKRIFQELASLLALIAPENWISLLSVYVSHDGAMKLKHYVKVGPRSDWRILNTGSVGFDIMDWWQNYQRLVKDAERNEFKFAKAQIDQSGHLQMGLSYEAVDPLSDTDILRIAESLSESN
ncbi:hypothetical protein JF541_16880 [Marinobacter hydrocarbonoclasticus]|uniref:hypothetical protein n=1 Tax=Marinobacter nauticus TaxID=2743 RepID=UPI001A8CAD17|nr:hypothetical protein [Marinobacter nauticus]MBN8240839.1 hypothetical protein [Marinobacter nauticus]